MLVHIEKHKVNDSLLSSVEGVLASVKQCLSKQTDAIEKQETILSKIDEDVIDLKKIIQTDNSSEIMKSNVDDLIKKLCDHIGGFVTKMSESFFGGDINTKQRNRDLLKIRGYNSSKKQKSGIIVVNEIT